MDKHTNTTGFWLYAWLFPAYSFDNAMLQRLNIEDVISVLRSILKVLFAMTSSALDERKL